MENGFPQRQGIYWVKIRTNTGSEKICKADWVPDKGFSPIAETLKDQEYVFEWCNID